MTNSFCFIVCTNNKLWFDECAGYIERLNVPDGYEVFLLAIEEAESMTAGYNEGMQTSDAKYKIYLHQDTFIINQNMLYDILDIFSDPSIGLIGIVGSPKLPADGMMWHGAREGALYVQQPYKAHLEHIDEQAIHIRDVDCVDGLMMITQYDIPWRSDLFGGWDFYDISQCFEYRRKGYKVVVPIPDNPWVIHDAGKTILWNYDQNRQIFLQEYGDMLRQE